MVKRSVDANKQAMIECENLVKIYKTKDIEVLALQGLELRVDTGEMMAIIGNSGSGKSTFLNMIGGLARPSAGRLFVDGKNLFKLTDRELAEYKRSTVGFVWQNNARNLLPYLTASENVQMPMMITGQKQRAERALELLEIVGMAHRKNSKLSELSGGEQQRVAIARAMAHKPRVIFADEPTAELDTNTGLQVIKIFKELAASDGITFVMTTHDTGLMDFGDCVYELKDGELVNE